MPTENLTLKQARFTPKQTLTGGRGCPLVPEANFSIDLFASNSYAAD
jgi:hypothetical protein